MAVLTLKWESHLELDLSRTDINCKRPPKQNLEPTVLCVYLCMSIYVCYKGNLDNFLHLGGITINLKTSIFKDWVF